MVPRDFLSPDPPHWGSAKGTGALGSWDLMVIETWIEMLRDTVKHISSLLKLGASVDAFLGAWTSGAHPLGW
jgi:hypothetical protein